MFHTCITRRPSQSIDQGITSSPELGNVDYSLALKQHQAYVEALQACDVKVEILEAMDEFPDACFVEDVAVCTDKCAIITNPGAPSRKKEIDGIVPVIRSFYDGKNIHYIKHPGTLEGGDVMMVGNHFYIGLSERTNQTGADQLIHILQNYEKSGQKVPLSDFLHLKTGLSYLENNHLLVGGEFKDHPLFKSFDQIEVPPEETYACNCIWVNDRVIVPEGYPITLQAIQDQGYQTLLVDTSEYKKIDGGLSCLSLRF